MGSRLNLQTELENLLGTKNVYFQPPPSNKMEYPCIVYGKARINTVFADNNPYQLTNVYQVTYIDSDPDSEIPTKLANMHQCVFERNYKTNELYHNVFRLTY